MLTRLLSMPEDHQGWQKVGPCSLKLATYRARTGKHILNI